MNTHYLMKRNNQTYLLSDPKCNVTKKPKQYIKNEILKRLIANDDELMRVYYKTLQKELIELKQNILAEQPKIDYLNEKIEKLNGLEYTHFTKQRHELKNLINRKQTHGEDTSKEEQELKELLTKEPKEQRDEYIAASKIVGELRKLGPYRIINSYLGVVNAYEKTKAEKTQIALKFADDFETFKKYYKKDYSKAIELVINDDKLFFAILNEYFTVTEIDIKDF